MRPAQNARDNPIYRAAYWHKNIPASMRPAQNARDNTIFGFLLCPFRLASMRPAQNARDNGAFGRETAHLAAASMRPAQNARDNLKKTVASDVAEHRFNEARAKRTG